MRFKIILSNKSITTKTTTYVDAYCFAEAASQAYLLKNNRNQTQDDGWWGIHSVEEAYPEGKNNKWDWGWSSEGEMT
tara:strand:- start:59 stop:289 length:231 start_codon:yes stop_codon:yes gene_type:complete